MTEIEPELSLDLLRAGDRNELARLVEAYSPSIYRLASRMLGNAQDAEDVLQTTFLKVFKALADFEGRSSLSTWIYRIAANEALMMMRRKQPAYSLDEEVEDEEGGTYQPKEMADWSALPEAQLLDVEAQKQLDRAIQTLPAKLRSVFLLRDVEGLSIRETAEALSLTETNVKTRLLRARLFLREQLSAYYTEKMALEK